jgi:hypothetical protein
MVPAPTRHGKCCATPRNLAAAAIGLCAAHICGPLILAAQGPRSTALNATPTTSLVGVVGDSLHGGPLAGAVVMVDGQSREAVTDSIGRFRMDSVAAGRYRLGVFHPILDSLGTSLASRPVRFLAGKPILISLATPSGRTLRHAICPELPTGRGRVEHGDSGVAVLVGRVLDPESDAPVAGASITLSWIETVFNRQAIRATPYQRATTADNTGDFRLCALPSGLNGVLRVAAGPDGHDVVERELGLENRIVTMTTVHLPGPDSSGTPRSVDRAVLSGAVERPDGTPLAGATAVVEGTTDSATTGADGTFTMRHLPTGTHMVLVRAVGFEEMVEVVELAQSAPQHVVVALTTPAPVLATVRVEAHLLQAGYARVGFDRRQREEIGQFLTADDIAQKHALVFSQLFTGVTGIQRSYGFRGANGAGGRGSGSCLVYVLDGHPFTRIGEGELDAMFRPDEIAGIEIYNAPSVPPQFRVGTLPSGNGMGATTSTDGCTTIVVWTKANLGARIDG